MSTYSDVQNLKASLFDPELVSALAETFKVLGDATRVRILDVLSRDELCVGDIAGILGLSESAVSHQLRLLRSARLVRQRRAGQMVFYALDDHHVVRLFEQGSEHVRERAAGIVSNENRPAEPPLAPRQHAVVAPALDGGTDARHTADSHATAADLGQER
ncbi:MAG: metalloregulator ArsR/SmtB family transcription factor [Vicinamibacterales bacterium]